MAFENFPEPEKTTYVTERKKSSAMPIIIGLLAAALIGTWAYMLYNRNQTVEQITQKDNVIASTTSEKDQLTQELQDATARYDMLKSSNSKLDSTITAKDRDIAEKRNRIQELLNKSNATAAELREARSLIASLNTDIESYKNQVEILQGQKIQLTQEKVVVTGQRDKAIREYDSATVVIKERDSTIDIGSTLQASNFRITPINEKSSGKEKATDKVKRVDKLRISFDLIENMIAQSGTKEVFVRITAPDGTPIAVDALGSGVFTTRAGEQMPFTKKLDVEYMQNKRQNITFDWSQNSPYQVGNYKIEVYNKEAMILMHDANDKRTTVEALPMIIEQIQNMDDNVIVPITDETVPVQHVTAKVETATEP